MTAYTIYLFCLVVGLVFTLFSVVAGHFVGGHGDHVGGSGGHAEAGADNSDIPATRPVVLSAPLSGVAALVVAGLLFLFLRSVFTHTQSSSESHIARLAGTEASIVSPIPENGVGEIAYVVGGTRYTAPARAENGLALGNGKLVKITRVVGTQFYVTVE